MPQVGFELTILVFEQAKTVHVLDPVATVGGYWFTSDLVSSIVYHIVIMDGNIPM
jgi:hypothetical protein